MVGARSLILVIRLRRGVPTDAQSRPHETCLTSRGAARVASSSSSSSSSSKRSRDSVTGGGVRISRSRASRRAGPRRDSTHIWDTQAQFAAPFSSPMATELGWDAPRQCDLGRSATFILR
jgi:hypothetical protein